MSPPLLPNSHTDHASVNSQFVLDKIPHT
jgi:hypothetical protein